MPTAIWRRITARFSATSTFSIHRLPALIKTSINSITTSNVHGGVAMAMALGGVYLPEHQRFAIHTNVGFFNGSQAIGVQAIGRINQTFTANGGVAYDLNGRAGVGGRVGISAGW